MARMAETLCMDNIPMLNDCILCDTAERMRAEGRTSWSVSISGQPLCWEHHYEIMMERAD